MQRNLTRLFSCLLSILLCVSIIFPSVLAVNSSTDSKYDFSDVDDINIYDTYEKETPEAGTTFVPVKKLNRYDPDDSNAFSSSRYGAFLRNANEIQSYEIPNAPYSSVLGLNILTIYADPEVDFTLTDYFGNPVANSQGTYDSEKVAYYNQTTDSGHNVYFIELVPAEVKSQWQMLRFSTTSVTVQPHYSFWFGNPLMENGTVSGNLFTVKATSPNQTSPWVTVKGPTNVPKRSWVLHVTVNRITSSGDSNIKYSNAKLVLTLPNGDRPVFEWLDMPPMVYDCHINNVMASPVTGNYKFRIEGLYSWSTPSKLGGSYSFTGRMVVEYVYAFGA